MYSFKSSPFPVHREEFIPSIPPHSLSFKECWSLPRASGGFYYLVALGKEIVVSSFDPPLLRLAVFSKQLQLLLFLSALVQRPHPFRPANLCYMCFSSLRTENKTLLFLPPSLTRIFLFLCFPSSAAEMVPSNVVFDLPFPGILCVLPPP